MSLKRKRDILFEENEESSENSELFEEEEDEGFSSEDDIFSDKSMKRYEKYLAQQYRPQPPDNPTSFRVLKHDVFAEILSKMNPWSVSSFCQVERFAANICKQQSTFEILMGKHFPNDPIYSTESAKEQYMWRARYKGSGFAAPIKLNDDCPKVDLNGFVRATNAVSLNNHPYKLEGIPRNNTAVCVTRGYVPPNTTVWMVCEITNGAHAEEFGRAKCTAFANEEDAREFAYNDYIENVEESYYERMDELEDNWDDKEVFFEQLDDLVMCPTYESENVYDFMDTYYYQIGKVTLP